ncbi:MAG: flagellar hook-length control protein FliK [Phycisphaerales bacterium]|nr:flagellar hook-length control protein FliK [Planctomycetota bacterium]
MSSAQALTAGQTQAKAARQNALVALMSATNTAAAPNDGGAIFSDVLESAADKRNPAGLFSENSFPASAPDAKIGARDRRSTDVREIRRDREDATTPAQQAEAGDEDRVVTDDNRSTTGGFKPEHSDPCASPGEADIRPIDTPANAALPINSVQTAEADAEINSRGSHEGSAPAARVASGPTDPLRLIPQPQTPEKATDTDGSASPTSGATANQNAVANAGKETADHPQSGSSPGGTSTTSPADSTGAGSSKQATMTAVATHGAPAPYTPVTTATGGDTGTQPVSGSSPTTGPSVGTQGAQTVRYGREDRPVQLKLTAAPTSQSEPAMTQSEADAVAKSLGRALGPALNQQRPQITLWLTPETLGKLKVSLAFDQGTVSARFEATNQATADLLAGNTDALRSALESRGLRADKIEVLVPNTVNQSVNEPTTASKLQDSSFSSQQQNPGGSGQWNSSGQGNQGSNPHTPQRLVTTLAAEQEPAGAAPRIEIRMDGRTLLGNARLELDALA